MTDSVSAMDIDLMEARVREIAALNHAIGNPQTTKLIFQKLPVHMRRRAMPHDPKRMPIRLREAHLRQMQKSGLPPKSKRPSRKYRRRPNNLLKEYNRRQQSKVWLSTHIWHAKRFHMTEKWGYKIANYNNSRGLRANYRAICEGCMIQDISYYNCIELVGSSDEMIDTLKKHCDIGRLTFGAKYYLKGEREGSLTFYKLDGTPIGVLNFLYRPNTSEHRTIWIWIHPALSNEVIKELMISFKFVEISQSPKNDSTNKIYCNENNIEMRNLTKSFNRFRLSGPMALSVLTDTLHLPALKNESYTDEISIERNVEESWYDSWYKDPNNISSFNMQRETLEAMRTLDTPSQLPRYSILGATVLDPRFYLPAKKTKPSLNSMPYKKIYLIEPLAGCSALWDSNVRSEVERNCRTTREINDIRSKHLISGVSNDSNIDENTMSKIPVILIQNPGTNVLGKSIGFTASMDIILPAKWGLPFWLSFMYRCPTPGGLRESRSILLESLMLKSPEINHPDTLAYRINARDIQKKLIEKYFRYPPNRRVNFVKCAISSPFLCEWKILIKEWTNQNTVSVLRDRIIITSLKASLENCTMEKQKRKIPTSNDLQQSIMTLQTGQWSLVAVKITILRKGNPKDFAIICLPTDEDMKKYHKNENWGGPVQESKFDMFEAQRKKLRAEHKIFLMRAMRRRRNARKAGKSAKPSDQSTMIVIKYAKIMKDLYLPQCTTVRNSCNRQVIGYVVQGGFSHSEAKGVGWGYVVTIPLLDIIKRKNNIVLVRNIQTRQYRCAELQILDPLL